jgi:hypothetical protein
VGQGLLPRGQPITEAAATLPSVGDAVSLDDIFSAVSLQQVRLKNDQQIPVWEPAVLSRAPIAAH